MISYYLYYGGLVIGRLVAFLIIAMRAVKLQFNHPLADNV
ncbi:putative membrane protein [Burkholderia pseudomallei]|nr:putative membrane protein [Burkholderia pseudomallei]